MAKSKATRTDGTTTGAPARRKSSSKLPKALSAAIKALQDKQAQDIVVLDLRAADGFTDFFLICTGQNARHIATLVDAVQKRLREDYGERPVLAEGSKNSEWILLDYFNFVVHVFSPELRSFYALERLWGSAERLEFPEEPTATR